MNIDARFNVVFLAGGPPKPGRNRHLEFFNGSRIIDRHLRIAEDMKEANVYIVVNKENNNLIDYIRKSKSSATMLTPRDETVRATIETALGPPGPCILVCGDLTSLLSSDIRLFLRSPNKSAICRYKVRWGPNLTSNAGLIRRSDVGDCIVRVPELEKEIYLSKSIWARALAVAQEFVPGPKDPTKWNDIMTYVNYVYFQKIWGDPNVNDTETQSSVFFKHKVYSDND